MSVYVRTSRNTGVSVPWFVAIFVGLYVGIFWLLWLTLKWSVIIALAVWTVVIIPVAIAIKNWSRNARVQRGSATRYSKRDSF